jgi:hypothetical protein
VYVTRGGLSIQGLAVGAKDQARVDVEEPLSIRAERDSEFVLIDVPSCKGWGYDEDTLRGARARGASSSRGVA